MVPDAATAPATPSSCGEFAAQRGLPFHLETRDIPREAREAGASFEAFARDARYDFFFRVARQKGCAVIATGHHADDQAETLLMRLARGTSPHGLAGIPPVRAHGSLRIVRPLLACRRSQLTAYLEASAIPYLTDSTNSDLSYRRNRVRRVLMPTLEKDYNPRVTDALCRLAEIQRDEDAFLADFAQAFLDQCLTPQGYLLRAVFETGHPALQRRAMTLWLWRHEIECPFEIVESARAAALDASAGSRVSLGAGQFLQVTRNAVELVSAEEPDDLREVTLQVPGSTIAFEKRISVRYRKGLLSENPAMYCTPGRQVFDADALGDTIVVRRRRTGDRFTPFGMSGTRKLSDYMSELGLPISERNTQLVVTAKDRIVWVVGHAIDAYAATTPLTRNIIEFEVDNAVI